MNTAIEQCLATDVGIARPEAGLIYIALRTGAAKVDEAFDMVDLEAPWMFDLNDVKMKRDWAPYFPFTLTIRAFDHLWAFMRGEIYLIVLVGPRQMEVTGSRNGNSATFDHEDVFYPLGVNFPDNGGSMRIASQKLARIGMECVSPGWLITNSLASWQRGVERAKDDPNTYIVADGSNIDPLWQRYIEPAGILPPLSSDVE